MLPRLYRLTKNKDFERLAKAGQVNFSPEMMVKWLSNGLDNSRFGFVVSKKISKSAVVRNQIKRRLRAIIYKKLEVIKPGYDIMILTKPAIQNLVFLDLEQKLLSLLIKARLL